VLDLSMLDFADNAAWHWRLTDQAGTLVAQHDVQLDRTSTEFRLLTDLYRNLWLLEADPARRPRSERELLNRVGAYTASEVFGPAGQAIAQRAPVTVRVIVPPAAVGVLAMPLELADWGKGPLALCGTVFCYVPGSWPPEDGHPKPVGQLRVLAIFALPETSSALGLVQERRALIRVLQDDPTTRGAPAADLRVLQYGATKKSVREALGEAEGWDVIHVAGHGGPGRLYLENEHGGPEPVETEEFLSWLAPCQGRTRLVVLSACESGVARVARTVGTRRMPPHALATGAATALGYEVGRVLGCTVLATRYPVDDRFSVTFTRMWYEALVRDGRPADDVIRAILPQAVRAARGAPLSLVTPILLGRPDAGVTLPSSGRPAGHDGHSARRRTVLSGVPGETGSFIGRTAFLARLGEALAPGREPCGVVVVGMPGIGKTEVVTEAVYRYGRGFAAVNWHRATCRDTVRSLARAMTAAGEADDLAGLSRSIRSRDLLLIIDNAQALLTSTGTWRGELGNLIAALCEPGGRAHLILVSDRPLPGLPSTTAISPVPMFSRSESEWLARELQEAGLAAGPPGDGAPAGLPWLVCRGNPRLIEHCSTGTAQLARRRTIRIDKAWEITTPLAPRDGDALRPLGRTHPGSAIAAWARGRTVALPAAAQRAVGFLASMEQPDRTPDLTSLAWELLARETGVDVGGLDEAAISAQAAGLVERSASGLFLLHPAVTHVGRELDRGLHEHTARGMYVIWNHYYQQAQDEPGTSQRALGHCTASMVPYLMRLCQWEQASAACERAINHDGSPAMAARLLSYDRQIVRASEGTQLHSGAMFVYANLLRTLDEKRGLIVLERLYDRAVRDEDDATVMVTASAVATMLTGKDPGRAYEFLQRAKATSTASQHQSWAAVRLGNSEAQIRLELGDWAGALTQAQAVLDELDRLTPADTAGWAVNPHSERGVALTMAAAATDALGQPEQADRYRGLLRDHDQASSSRAAAETQFNAIAEMIRRGKLDEAYNLLVAALVRFTEPGDTGRQGLILIQLASVEHQRNHHHDAVSLGRRALRASYAAGERLDAAAAHGQMANLLATAAGDVAAEAPVHILAAAVIHMRVAQGLMAVTAPLPAMRALARLTHCLAREPQLVPQTFAELQHKLQRSTGVDIAGLLAGLDRAPVSVDPASGNIVFHFGDDRPPRGDSVTDALCWAMHRPSPDELTDVDGHLYHWQPIIDAVITAADDPEAQRSLSQVLDDYRGMGWSKLADAIGALLTDRSAVTPSALPPAERTVIKRILDALAGSPTSKGGWSISMPSSVNTDESSGGKSGR
jgi:CHAT domain